MENLADPSRTDFARSLLYVPGDQRARLDKALERGADAVIVDLEDAVAARSKVAARGVVTDWMQSNSARADSIWLRIDSDSPENDIATISTPIAGIMVPGAERQVLERTDQLLTAREELLGIAAGTIAVIPLIETARGLLAAVELATMPRVAKLAIGRADLAAELALEIDPEGPAFSSILLSLVIASSAAGIVPPLAPTSTDFRDLDALRRSTENLRRLGFRGRTAIHPAQIAVINEVFTPTPEEVTQAERIVAAFEEAERSGSGVSVDDSGRMVDAAVVRSARGVLARASSTRVQAVN